MKNDMLQQFVSLRVKLLREKAELISRLSELNRVLSEEQSVASVSKAGTAAKAGTAVAKVPAPARGGRKPKVVAAAPAAAGRPGRRKRAQNKLSLKQAVMAATKGNPLSRQDLLRAVQNLGYVFTAKDPLNSLSTLLYSDKDIKNMGGKFGPA